MGLALFTVYPELDGPVPSSGRLHRRCSQQETGSYSSPSPARGVKLPALLSPLHWYGSHILVCGQVSGVQARAFAHLATGCMEAKVCPTLLHVNKGTHFWQLSACCSLLPFPRGRQSL